MCHGSALFFGNAGGGAAQMAGPEGEREVVSLGAGAAR